MLLVGRIWKIWGYWTRKAVGCFKWAWKGHICRSMEDNAEGNLNSGAPAQELSEGKVISK